MKELNKMIGEKIRKIRKQRGYTLRQLAKNIGFSASFLSDVENGKVGISMERIGTVARELQIPISYLLGEDDLKDSADVMVQQIEKEGVLYEIFLTKHKFPNGLTYEQMCDKIKLLEDLENKKEKCIEKQIKAKTIVEQEKN